jgi:hypothetical protein
VKPTDEMYAAMKEHNPAARNIMTGLDAALKDVPDVVPFAFSGYPENPVYLHSCGTVIDVAPMPGDDTWADVEQGRCDCESRAPWLRIYVERA